MSIEKAKEILERDGKLYVEEIDEVEFRELKRRSDRGEYLYDPREQCFYDIPREDLY